MRRIVIDRVESGSVIAEDLREEQSYQLPISIFTFKPSEGEVIDIDFKIREDIEKQRRENIRSLQNELIEKPDE